MDAELLADNHWGSTATDTQLKDIKKTLPLRVLSEEDWQHWITRGYVIVRQAVPQENVKRLVDLLWEFDEKDPSDPSTWYTPQRRAHKMQELNNAGMLEIYNHQYLWDNRMQQRVYDAFVDIWDREDLWVSIDRANLNPPKKNRDGKPGFIHWDVDTSLHPQPISVQGVLSLVKQDEETGGFQCIPKLFEEFEDWVKTQPENRDPKHPDYSGFEIENIEMEPGDLMIFNALLAHGIRPNNSEDKVRIAQYISMFPSEQSNKDLRQDRIHQWRELEPPQRASFPGDPRDWEKKNAKTADLTELGKKLLGLERW
ncbi:phytanoyl-CoA dioxygenase family protein [Pseudovibrio ascidiaceicola]|uniref:phytanoyl-CoA dioxygenase family protein n=1 Tax=Pseudovibrio ascidiaceicola TaxID=285279 RepID=UPI000D69AD11|nr:phytanoyl-CoA dioxygenase family protein [Pseudovibrio ascidiaceicola]